MDGNDNFTRPTQNDSAISEANNLSRGHSPITHAVPKDHIRRSGLPVRIQDGRHRSNMNLRKLFTRDGNVHGLIRRTKRARKGLVFDCFPLLLTTYFCLVFH